MKRVGNRSEKLPYPNGKENFEMTVFLLQQKELLDAAVHICSSVIPRITRVMLTERLDNKRTLPARTASYLVRV